MSDSSRPRAGLDRRAARSHAATTPRAARRLSISPHQRRLARSVASAANRILEPHEEVLAISEAIADIGPMARAVLGAMWPSCQRVALLFTPRRLLEISIGSRGRSGVGRIRSFPWDGIPSFAIADDWLEVRTWDQGVQRWFLRDVPDPAVEGMLLKRVNLAVSTYAPSLSRAAPLLHCSSCGAAGATAGDGCRRCGSEARTPRRAGLLALAAPGAGHLYAQHPVAAGVRLVAEVLAFALLAAAVLLTTDPWRVLTIVALGASVLGLVKLHAAWSARLLTDRAGMVGAAAARRWRWLTPVAGVLSAAILVSPLLLMGALEESVGWRLAFADSEREWTVSAAPFPAELAAVAGLTELWSHRDGQWVLVQSWPFARFESTAAATARVAGEWGVQTSPIPLGAHRVLEASGEARSPEGRRLETAVLIVIDGDGRDVHALTTGIEPGFDRREVDRLRRLVAKSYWARREPG